MVRLFLCGVGGAGKTTLAEKLMQRRGFKKFGRIQEVARKVMKRKGITKADLENQEDSSAYLRLQELVMEAQRAEEERQGSCLISDRSLLDCLTYILLRRDWTYMKGVVKRHQVCSHNMLAFAYMCRRWWRPLWHCTSGPWWCSCSPGRPPPP